MLFPRYIDIIKSKCYKHDVDMRIQQGKDRVQTTLQPGDRAVMNTKNGSVTFYRGPTPLIKESSNESSFGFENGILPFQRLCHVVAEFFGLEVTKKGRDQPGTFAYTFIQRQKPKKK